MSVYRRWSHKLVAYLFFVLFAFCRVVANVEQKIGRESTNPYPDAVSGQKSTRRSQRSKGGEAVPSDSATIRPAEHASDSFTALAAATMCDANNNTRNTD